MPAKIPKPTIPINTDSKKIGLLQLGEQLIKNNQGLFQAHKTQNEFSVEEKISKDVQKHLKDYLLAVAKTGCSSSTIRNYRSDINQFLDFADSKDLNDLRNKPKLLAFAHYQRNKGLKENSIKRKLVSITQFKIWLKQQGLISSEIPLQSLTANEQRDQEERKIINQGQKEEPKETKTPDVIKQKKTEKPQSRIFLLLNLLALFLFLGGLAYFAYQQFGQAIISLAYPSTPTAPNSILSYQGRLTNTAQSPISDPTAMTYTLYDNATGGSVLWSSNTCTIDPDQDGIFNANLGAGVGTGADNENCGGAIGEDVFTLHNNVWLEVVVGAETLTPRQPIRTVAYALNAATLQGLPVTEVASNSTILMMNSAGEVVLGTNNPIIKTATGSSGMTIESNQITIQTTTSSNGDIILAPDGDGEVQINSADLVLNDGTIYSNSYAPASNSANISFVLPSSGNNLNFLDNSGLSTLVTITGDGQMGIGTGTPNHALDIAGNLGLNTGAYINWGATDGETGYGIRDSGGTLQYKSSGGTWADIGSGGGGGDSLWTSSSGALYANNPTLDFLIGSNATASAKFAFTNISGGKPTFSMANQASAFDLLNSTVNALDIESGLMSFDTLNSRIGIGTTSPGALLGLASASSTRAQLNLVSSAGVDPTTPNNGDLWWDGTSLNFYNGTTTTDILAGGDSLWVDAGTYIYPLDGKPIGDPTSGGTNKVSGLYLADSGPLYFGTDNDINFSFSGSTLTTTLGLNSWNIANDLLYLDGTTNQIGIGTTSPLATFDVRALDTDMPVASFSGATNLATLIVDQSGSGDIFTASASGATQFVITKEGNVGIGINDPTSRLQIAGAASTITNDTGDITIDAASGNISFAGDNIININDGLFSGSIGVGTTTPARKVEIVDSSNPQLRLTQTEDSIYADFNMNANGDLIMNVDGITNQFVLDNGGNVGIGLTNPDEKLTVSGSINAEKYYDYTNKNYFLDPAAISTSLKTAGDAHIGGDVYVEGGEIFITPMSLSTSTTEGTVYYDDDVDHLYLYDGNSTWHRIALDMTKYSTYGTISNQDYLQIAHNQNSNDLTFAVWIKDAITNLWRKIDPTSSSIDHDLDNEFNPEYTQKEKVTSVSLKLQNDSLGTGADGEITVSTSRSINDYDSITGRSCPDGGDAVNYSVTGLTSTTATLEAAPSDGCLAIGDEVLLINLRGTPSAYGNVGNYETLRIQSIDTSTNTINFTTAKTKYYGDGVADDTNVGIGTGAQDVMLQRVPNYTNVTVDATYSFYPDEWIRPSGSAESGAGGAGEGGVMFFRATGTVTVNGTITTLGRGYIAGTYAGDNVQQYQGDSTTGVGGLATTSLAEGGGGGGYRYCTGGGGGGYATAGTNGVKAGTSCDTVGAGGPAYPTAGNTTLDKLYFGSGGGAGGTGYLSTWTYDGTRGGDGGGVIYIATDTINVSGAVTATGEAGTNRADLGGSDISPGAGGGGAGGSLKIVGSTLNLGTSKVTANGGAGGTTGYSNYGSTYADLGGYAHGGAGGSGVVATYYAGSISGSTSPTYTIDTATGGYNSYKTYISKELAVNGANSFGNLEWTENLPSGTEIQMQTRSGNTSNSTDGTWEAWRPTTTTLSINDANTHTDWIGTNATVADGDVVRNVNYYEDEDESTVGNVTKYTTSAANGYAERTLSSTNLSSYQYISLWIRSATAGSVITLGMGESAATEQTKTIKIETANVWQKVYWDISGITGTSRDAITKFRITSSINNNVVYLDNIKAETYLSTSTGSTITSTANNYIQYRAIMTTTSASVTPTLAEVRINYNDGSAKVITDKLSNQNDTDYYNQASLLNITTTSLDDSKSLDIQKTDTGITTKGAIDPGTGNDGDVVISTDRNINTYNSITGRNCTDGGDAVNYSITALTPRTATITTAPSTGCLVIGDEVLLINLKGNATSTINVGNYETLRVENISDNVIRFTTAKTKFYGDNSTDDSNIGTDSGNQNVMLQRVPNYNSLVVDAGVTFSPSDFDGLKNGVIFFRSKITSINGSITAQGSGYRGTTYAGDSVQQYQGSSTTGTGDQSINFKAEGGGGGAQDKCAGGGGGGYATAGSDGVRAGTSCESPGTGGPNYPTYGNPSLSKLYFGSGGGAGGTGYISPNWTYDGGGGGAGGGIVYISSGSLVVSGYLRADGDNGTSVADLGGTADITPGAGGGGAGGSLKIVGSTLNLGTSKVTANGGAGGTTGYSNFGSTYADLGGYAHGGNGGSGIVAITYGSSISGSSNPTYNVAQVPAYTSSVFVSDEIATPNAVSYDKISWLADETSHGIVEVQTRSGATSNSTDGSWEEWKPATSSATILNSADTHTDWTASDTTITIADGDVTRNINYYEDEDEVIVGNTTKLTTTSNSVAYAESKIAETDLSQKSFITLWVYSSNSGSTVKIGFGENTSSEHETLVKIDAVDTWQKVYWDISHIPTQERDAVRLLKVGTAVTNNTIRFDQFAAQKFASDPAGTVVASRPNEYFQYRVILGSSNPAYRPVLYNIGMDWNNGYKVEQTNANTVRLYNYTGDEQEMRLDVIVFGADLAEWYTVNDESIGPADLVSITGEMDDYGVPILRKADKSNDRMLVGVISTQAGTALGIKADNRRLLALDGRVPVKIDPNSDPIEKGDHLTSSAIPGMARKAKPGELSIGRSFEAWELNSGKDRVLVIVNDAMATPSFGRQLVDGVVEIADLLNIQIQDTWEVVNYGTGETVKSAATLAQAIIGKLKVGQMEVSEIKAPEGETLSLEGSQVSFQLNDSDASGSSALGKLIIQNQDGETVASFDSEGNASISGQLDVAGISRLGKLIADEATFGSIITNEASISGGLIANNIQADSARLDYIESKLANLENASISGTLYAENIQTNNIQANMISGLEERLSSKIAETLNQPSLLASLFGEQAQQTDEYLQQLQQELNDITTENEDASLSEIDQESNDLTLIADTAFVDQYFEVNGNAYIADSLKLGQSLMIGEDTIVGNGFISYQPQLAEGEDFTFSIQPTGVGKLSLMANLMQLDSLGFVSINGDLKVAGVLEVEESLRVKDTLLTNLISANKAGESIKVQLASIDDSLEGEGLTVQKSNFEFINEHATPVASFSSVGDLALTGSLRLSQNIEIASDSGELVNSRSAGQAVLSAGSTEVTIISDKIEENSMIYVTPMNSTNNQVLYVKNKTTDSPFTPEKEGQFTVAIDYALGHNVVFNWWIIQLN